MKVFMVITEICLVLASLYLWGRFILPRLFLYFLILTSKVLDVMIARQKKKKRKHERDAQHKALIVKDATIEYAKHKIKKAWVEEGAEMECVITDDRTGERLVINRQTIEFEEEVKDEIDTILGE